MRPSSKTSRLATASLGILLLASPALALPPAAGNPEDVAFFENKIRPLLAKHCYECHSEAAGEQKGGLLLDRAAGWLEGGDTGKAVVPGDLTASLLISAVRRDDEDSAMPPKYALEEHEVKLLEAWVRRGAPGPAEDMGETDFSRLGDQDFLFDEATDHCAGDGRRRVLWS